MARPCEIRTYPDGPLLVRGDFALSDAVAGEIPVRRRTIAICRCGRSRRLPFCDGAHKVAGFRTGDGPPRAAGAPASRSGA